MHKFAWQKKLAGAGIFSLVLLFVALVGSQQVHAKSFYYDSYDVDIVVNRDTTMVITEKLNYVFDGNFSAVTRGIYLDNPRVRRLCQSSQGVTCGGFEYLVLEEVRGEGGRLLDPREYKVGTAEDEDNGEYYVIDWEFAPSSRFFDSKTVFPFTIKYKVYGGVRFVGDNPYFYWNVLPSERGGRVENTTITITLPDETLSLQNLNVYGSLVYATKISGNKLTLTAENLSSSSDVTVAYELSPGAIEEPARLRVTGNPIGQNLYIDGDLVGTTDFSLDYFPPGQHTLKGEFNGYRSKTVEVNLQPGETQTIHLQLEPEFFTQLLIYLNYFSLLCGCLLAPLLVFWVYRRWQNKGRDQDAISTIVPEFHPPTGMRPYMAGALIDESVDRRDIAASIIDFAYRGFIKIKEIDPGKNYELTSLKPAEGFSEVEQKLFTALFAEGDVVTTKQLSGKFATNYPGIVSSVYKQMVNDGYFMTSPQITRATNAGCGIAVISLGVVVAFLAITLAIMFIGQVGPFTIGGALIAMGVAWAISANYMPAKTTHGSKAANQVSGFKMYLETADKYRLESLGPEEFEKYLSYAIAFNVADKWAERFKDIYKEPPEWYEASSADAFNAYWLTRSMRSFSDNMQSMVFTPTSGGASGSGWSGGGSFGGFSGGGGGGGFSGAR